MGHKKRKFFPAGSWRIAVWTQTGGGGVWQLSRPLRRPDGDQSEDVRA